VKTWLLIVAAGWVLTASNAALSAGDATAGKSKSATCAACHGGDGNSANPIWPKIAGQHAKYMVKQLQNFKSGKRDNPTMAGMTAALSEQDMQDLAAYYSGQKVSTGSADPELVTIGEKIYRGGNAENGLAACVGCHGPSGLGNPEANFPSLGGQHSAYTVNQLKAFRDGQRRNDPVTMMRDISAKMTEREMRAVASYIQGLY